MLEKDTEREKNRQKIAVLTSETSCQKSEVEQKSEEITSDTVEPVEITSSEPYKATSKLCKRISTKSEVNRLFLSATDAAKIVGIDVRSIRDNAAAGKYTGAFKDTHGAESWRIPLDSLPTLAQAAERLFVQYGGCSLKVPCTSEVGVTALRLIDCMGEDAYRRFAATFGGERIAVPKNQEGRRADRNRQIIANYTEGESVPVLAKRYDLTERSIRTILGRPSEPDSAISLNTPRPK